MKKKHIYFGLLLAMILFAGCGKQEPAQSNESLFQSIENSEKEEKLEIVLLRDGISNDVLYEVLTQTDASEYAKYNVLNRMLSQDGDKNQQSLFCIDSDTGVVYFVNQNKDWFIYRLKDGRAELAVALPAKELYCNNGILYFMIEDYEKYIIHGAKNGDIYAYTPVKGVVELVYAAGNLAEGTGIRSKLTVNENGIYFVAGGERKPVTYNGKEVTIVEEKEWYLPFGEAEPEEDKNQTTQAGWKEFYPAFTKNEAGELELTLSARTGLVKDDIRLNLHNLSPRYYCVSGDMLYCCYTKEILLLNLETKEQLLFDCRSSLRQPTEEEAEKLKEDLKDVDDEGEFLASKLRGEIIESFTGTNNYIWASTDEDALLRIDKTSGEIKKALLEKAIVTLYTDGENVYGLDKDGYVARIVTEPLDSEEEIAALKVEYLTK